jgi:hypothetical protein
MSNLDKLGLELEKLILAEGSEAAMAMCLKDIARSYLETVKDFRRLELRILELTGRDKTQ